MLFLLSRLGYRSRPWIEHKRITAEPGRASREKRCWLGPWSSSVASPAVMRNMVFFRLALGTGHAKLKGSR